MLSRSGGDLVTSTSIQVLESEDQMLELANRLLPAWMTLGFRDFGCTIHSVGCSYFNALGEQLGYQSISELPVEHRGQFAFVGGGVRCDSAWFTKDKFEPIALVEFERYVGSTDMGDLITKVKNLVLACHRNVAPPAVSILAYWTKNSQLLPDHERLRSIFRMGFETPGRQRVPGVLGSQLRIYQMVHEPVERSDRWRLWKIKERTTA